ncbi:MAG: hypothetical protein FD152_4063 [Xanthobacteraceae bacterium]|nr:MAG: hypothetical protein FD152_4063 [Xanthobacteraceae bacterium]
MAVLERQGRHALFTHGRADEVFGLRLVRDACPGQIHEAPVFPPAFAATRMAASAVPA